MASAGGGQARVSGPRVRPRRPGHAEAARAQPAHTCRSLTLHQVFGEALLQGGPAPTPTPRQSQCQPFLAQGSALPGDRSRSCAHRTHTHPPSLLPDDTGEGSEPGHISAHGPAPPGPSPWPSCSWTPNGPGSTLPLSFPLPAPCWSCERAGQPAQWHGAAPAPATVPTSPGQSSPGLLGPGLWARPGAPASPRWALGQGSRC